MKYYSIGQFAKLIGYCRVSKCNCGLSIDRDFNASINLSNYKLA